MPKLEFVGQSAQDQSNIAANPSRLVNCYREPIASQGRAGYAIKSVPGLTLVSDLGGGIAAIATVSGQIYASAGGVFYRIAGGTATSLGVVPNGGDTIIAGNNGRVTVTADGKYRVWSGAAIVSPAAGAFSEYSGHEYIGNYTVLTERSGRRFQWSAIADATSLPGLSFSTADGRDDNMVRPMAINGALYLFKDTSHEVWYLTGGAGAEAFERQSGGVYDVGLKSHGLICKVTGGAFFVGDDNRAHLLSGGVTPVSIPAVEVAIRKSNPMACFTYDVYGHSFCVITFSDRPAWVYDIATGEWHERAEGAGLDPWAACCTTKAGGEWYVGKGAAVYRFDDVATDGGGPLVKEMTSRTLSIDRRQFVADMLEVFPRQGFNEQRIELQVSRDGGLTWGYPKQANIGPIGEMGRRVTWRGLGASRQLTARIRVSEGVSFTMDAECELIVR